MTPLLPLLVRYVSSSRCSPKAKSSLTWGANICTAVAGQKFLIACEPENKFLPAQAIVGRWITLSGTEEIAVQWISVPKTSHDIGWIVIYPAEKKIIFVNSLRFSFHWVNASSEQVPFGELTILNTGLQSRQGSDSCFSCVNQVKKFVMREITKEELDLWTRTGGVVEKLENWTAPYRDHLRRYTESIDIFLTMAGPRHTHFRIFGPF